MKKRRRVRFESRKSLRQYIQGEPRVPNYERPKTYGECMGMPRPCPFVGCRYHLQLECNKAGGLRVVPTAHTCALDLAAEGPRTSRMLANVLGVSRQRIDQEEAIAIQKLKAYCDAHGLDGLSLDR